MASSVDPEAYKKLVEDYQKALAGQTRLEQENRLYRRMLKDVQEVLSASRVELAGFTDPTPSTSADPITTINTLSASIANGVLANGTLADGSSAPTSTAAPVSAQPRPMLMSGPVTPQPQPAIPKFEGLVVPRDGSDVYWSHAYQYASSSESTTDRLGPTMQPKFIVYVKNDQDIKKAIAYATECKIAIAVRSGGHQYSGASSTSGENIQIDMTHIDEPVCFLDASTKLVRVSAGCPLQVVNTWLGAQKEPMFIPHGQCSHVHLGGHCQTGGVGQLLRSHGLFGDHIEKIELFDATGTQRIVGRDSTGKDKDLYWAILGGSPGNFGIITHLHVKPLFDKDFPESRGLRSVYRYNKETMKALLDVMVEWNNDPNWPADYDYCVTMLTSSVLGIPHLQPNLDQQMRAEYPDLYGHDGLIGWPPIIIVYLQFAGLPGSTFDSKYFDRIGEVATPLLTSLDGKSQTPMSSLTKDWIFGNVREFVYPFEKRCYLTNATTELVTNKWTDWVSDRIDVIAGDLLNGCGLSVQIQPFGGQSVYAQGNPDTSYSWRDTTICCVMDCFYDNDSFIHPRAGNTARDWQKQNDVEVKQHFSSTDRRTLWGSYGEHNLDSVHACYYDSEEKYQRLCSIKQTEDPNGIFTPNEFCVGVKARPQLRAMAHGLPSHPVHKFNDKRLAPVLQARKTKQIHHVQHTINQGPGSSSSTNTNNSTDSSCPATNKPGSN